MKDPEHQRPIARILVALDASSHSLAGLEAAVSLAARLKAELLGIYVEDINLLRLAEMPFAREFGQFSARQRKLDTGQLESQLRTQAERARLALEKSAEAAGLNWNFRVVRGSIPDELLNATDEHDLIILGQRGWSNFAQVGSTTQTIVTRAKKLTLILREGIHLGQSVLVVFDGTKTAEEALSLAGALAQDRDGKLILLIIARDQRTARQYQEEVENWGHRNGVQITIHWLRDANAQMICNLTQAASGGILVFPTGTAAISEADLLAVLIQINCPVMVVRQPGNVK
jgi:nucleotide-binding universal stress UspA family protein